MKGSSTTYEAMPVEYSEMPDDGVLDVYCWRLEALLRVGYGPIVADSLAQDLAVDLHLACELVDHGCDEQTAYRILS